MVKRVYHLNNHGEYAKAGATDLIEMLPVAGTNPLFLPKWVLEVTVYGIVRHEFIHISGPTGSAKSSFLEALHYVPDNFTAICRGLGLKPRPMVLYPIEMATYEAPGELYQRRALKNGTTFDEISQLVQALKNAERNVKKKYPLIWLREIGRVHSSSVQGGLLNLMTKGDIIFPDGTCVDGKKIAWVADSNYQAEQDSTHTLVTLDDALKRRFTINMTMDYLTAEQEVQVLEHILGKISE